MKQKKEREKKRIGYIVGGIVFIAGMCVIMPKLIEKGSEYLCRCQTPVKRQGEDEWNPEIVRKSTLEDE